MGQNSKIEWTEATWNPVTGCTKISPGCKHCYAERMAKRLKAMGQRRYRNAFKVTLQPDVLDVPLRWKRPRMVFVNSMSDLFHRDVPDEYIARCFATMEQASHHTFQVLTKRPERALELAPKLPWPENIWLGVTIENAQTACRADPLREIVVSTRFISYEPALEAVDWEALLPYPRGIDWLICGGESGPRARPMHPDWARAARDACQRYGVAFFFKQWGEWCCPEQMPEDTYAAVDNAHNLAGHGAFGRPWRVGKKRAGRLLDGREWNDCPEAAQE
jgi:protein gp37